MEFDIPSNLKYSKTHEFARIDGNEAVIGISDFAQKQLGDIIYVEFPEIGQEYAKGEEMAEIESVKAIGELYSPISCKIIEVNEIIKDNPELVNSSPYEEGWLVKVEISKLEEVSELLSPEEYEAFVAEKSM